MRQLTKRERITFLLEHWQDIHDPAGTTSDNTGRTDDAGIPLSPRMSQTHTLKELRRCLTLLAKLGPRHYKHLTNYYGCVGLPGVTDWTQWRLTDTHKPSRTRRGKPTTTLIRTRQRITPTWIEPHLVDRATDVITTLYNGDIYIPNELLDLAA